jgi:hypothetical protein
MLVNCSINTSDNVTLYHTKLTNKETMVSDNKKKIKIVAKNVFNLTNITFADAGTYTCKACNKPIREEPQSLHLGLGKILIHFNESIQIMNHGRNTRSAQSAQYR